MLNKLFSIFCYVVVAGIILAGLLDLLFFTAGGTEMTLSYRFWHLCKEWPVVSFVFGFFSGHLVYQYPTETKKN